MEFEKLMNTRHSTRGFSGKRLSEDEVRELVRAGTLAPNACNMQSWHFYAVVGDAVEKLYPDSYANEWIKTAGAAILVCAEDGELCARFGERARDLFILQDTAAAATMILLRAADMGMSGCFIGSFREEACRCAFSVKENHIPVALLAIGYETEPQTPEKSRKPLDSVLTIVK